MRNRILERFLVIVGVLLYALVLHQTFQHMIAPINRDTGLIYRAPRLEPYALMIAATVAVALLLPQRLGKVSDVILWVIFVFAAAPSILLPQYSQIVSIGEATQLGLVVAGSFVMARFVTDTRGRLAHRIVPLPMSRGSFTLATGAIYLLVGTFVLTTSGVNLSYLSFDAVYGVRADFATVTQGNRVIGYGLPALANILNPLLIAYGMLSKRFGLVALGVAGQLVIYSTNGTKNTLFSVLFVAAIVPLAHRRLPAALTVIGVALGAAAAAGLDLAAKSVTLTTLTVRRALVVPGALTAAYVSIFDNLPKVHFAEVLFFVDSPYTSVTRLVGRLFINNDQTSANVNLFGHGFAQWGYPGIVIECLVLALMLRVANWATEGLPLGIAAAMFLMPAQAISEASVFTALLTHGFLAAVILSAVAPRYGWERTKRVTAAAAPGDASVRRPAARTAPRR